MSSCTSKAKGNDWNAVSVYNSMNLMYSTTVNTTAASCETSHGIASRKNSAACPIMPASLTCSRIRSPNWPLSPAVSNDNCEEAPCMRNWVAESNARRNNPAFWTARNTSATLNNVPATIFTPNSRSDSMRVELRASSKVNTTAKTTEVNGLTATSCTFTANW